MVNEAKNKNAIMNQTLRTCREIMEDQLTCVREIYKKVTKTTKFTNRDYQYIAGLYVTTSPLNDELLESLSNDTVTGLMNVVFEKTVPEKQLTNLFKFCSVIAIEAYRQECKQPLSDINECIDHLLDTRDVHYRSMGCRLLAVLLNHASQLQSTADSQDFCLPSEYIDEWCHRLSIRLLDKSAQVRSITLEAFAKIPIEDVISDSNNNINPIKIIARSLYDISSEVRKVAINLLPLSSEYVLDEAILFLANEQDFQLRKLMTLRLCNEVHLRSFSMQQRMRLVTNLNNDSHPSVRLMLGTVLVPKWLKLLSRDEKDDDFEVCNEENDVTKPAYPMALMDYIDFLEEEDISVIVLKVAFSYYMEQTVGNRSDAQKLLVYLRNFPKELRESLGILNRSNFPDVAIKDDIDLPQRLFVHRSLVELICSVYSTPENYGNKDYCLNKLLPNFMVLSNLFKEYAEKIFLYSEIPSTIQVFTLRQISYLIHRVDRECSLSREIYESALKRIILDERFCSPLSLIEFAVREQWTNLANEDHTKYMEWLSETITDLLDFIEIFQDEEKEFRLTDEKQYFTILRAATVIYNVFRNERAVEIPVTLIHACVKMVPLLFIGRTLRGRQLCCLLLGVVGVRIQGSLLNHHLIKLASFLDVDRAPVKDTALAVMIDLIIKRGLKYVADRCFIDVDDEDRRIENLKALILKVIHAAERPTLERMLITACRLCYYIIWHELIGTILFKLFSKGTDLDLVDMGQKFFSIYVDAQGCRAKIPLLNGFMYCVRLAENSQSFPYGRLMSFVAGNISRVFRIEKYGRLPYDLTIETVFLHRILREIMENPTSKTSSALACVCLCGINLNNIPENHMRIIRIIAEKTTEIIRKNGDRKTENALIQHMRAIKKRLGEKIEKPIKIENQDIKKEPEDPDYIPYRPKKITRKRQRKINSKEDTNQQVDSRVLNSIENTNTEGIIEETSDEEVEWLDPPSPKCSTRSKPKTSQPVVTL